MAEQENKRITLRDAIEIHKELLPLHPSVSIPRAQQGDTGQKRHRITQRSLNESGLQATAKSIHRRYVYRRDDGIAEQNTIVTIIAVWRTAVRPSGMG